MAAQRVRVTWEFTVDDSERASLHMEQYRDVARHIDKLVATSPGTFIKRIEIVPPKMPIAITTTHGRERRS